MMAAESLPAHDPFRPATQRVGFVLARERATIQCVVYAICVLGARVIERIEGDLVIVGGGTAGVACAITAAEHGVRPIVIEKTDDIGGTLHLSSGQLSAAGARRQRERGIEDSAERHFADVMRLSRQTADPVLLRLAVQEAPHTIDWLEDLGFDFEPDTPAIYYGHEPYSVARTYWGPEGGRSVLKVLRRRWDEEVAAGRITIHYEYRAERLIRKDGGITGVRATGPMGQLELRAPLVVLTTGGYGANHDFFADHTPGPTRLISACRQSSTGDGIIMALREGATLRGAEQHLPTVGGFEPVPGSGRAGQPPQWAILNPRVWPAHGIHVNRLGERFLAEDEPSPDRRERALLQQPGHCLWVVFDEATLARGDSFHPLLGADELRQLADYGMLAWKARDLGTLARKAGIDEGGLIATVERWNEAARTGRDPLGVAKPGPLVSASPFYAVLINSVVVTTFGGLTVDGRLRVLDAAGQAIPGLYAAGEALGTTATSGGAFCGGMLATPALSFGRILGRTLAARRPSLASVGR